MFDGIIHLTVDHLLIVGSIVFLTLPRESHHAISKERHLIVGVGVDAIGHLVFGRLLLRGRSLTVFVLAGCEQGGGGYSGSPGYLEELSSGDWFHGVVGLMVQVLIVIQLILDFLVKLVFLVIPVVVASIVFCASHVLPRRWR